MKTNTPEIWFEGGTQRAIPKDEIDVVLNEEMFFPVIMDYYRPDLAAAILTGIDAG